MLCTLVVVLDVSRCVCIFITSTGFFTYGNGRVYCTYEEREICYSPKRVSQWLSIKSERDPNMGKLDSFSSV